MEGGAFCRRTKEMAAHWEGCCLFDEIYIETIRAEICYTYIYLDFIVIRPQKIIIFIFLQTEISKFLQINIFVRRTHEI